MGGVCAGAGADAQEAESDGEEEAACMKPDGAQMPGEVCVHNLAHSVSSLWHLPFPCGWYGYVHTVVTPLRVRTAERLKKN